jgi:RNA polymerase sigma-70 factor (ECF subfamily)
VDLAELIRHAQTGNQAALGLLLKAYRKHLRQLAEHGLPDRLKTRVDASDVVQQTCVSVFRLIAGFRGSDPEQFAAWLQVIHERNIQNAIRDQLRTRKRGDGLELHLAGQDVIASEQATPSRHAMRQEESAQLARALDRLPDDEREVLRLRYLEGQTLVQVGDELGLTKDAVVWLMQKGMKRLRQWLPRSGDPQIKESPRHPESDA